MFREAGDLRSSTLVCYGARAATRFFLDPLLVKCSFSRRKDALRTPPTELRDCESISELI